MDYEAAKRTLLLHGPGIWDDEVGVLEDGFLGCLRPYSGLRERNFHLVMEALFTVGETLHRSASVDRDLVHAVWSIVHTARGWGLRPDGMLRRNGLITATDTVRLERWVDTIASVALSILNGKPPHYSVYKYARYVVEVGWGDNIAYFVGLMDRAVSDPAVADSVETIVEALGKLGRLASETLPTLREAEKREYTW